MSVPFISGDWGTSRLRLRLVDSDPIRIVAEVRSDRGISATFADWQAAGSPGDREGFYFRVLAPLIDQLADESGRNLSGLTLVLSGMASSSIGLRELPYAVAPIPMRGDSIPVARIDSGEIPTPVLLVTGVRTDDDVMRGEETIVLGLADVGIVDGLYLLPGTHSKHLNIVDGNLAGFRTYLTGELFDLLRTRSVLRTCVEAGSSPDDDFRRAVIEAPRSEWLRELFGLRAATLIRGAAPLANGQRLSGLLIGIELAGLAGTEGPIFLAADGPLRAYYEAALDCLGLAGRVRTFAESETILALVRGQEWILARKGVRNRFCPQNGS